MTEAGDVINQDEMSSEEKFAKYFSRVIFIAFFYTITWKYVKYT